MGKQIRQFDVFVAGPGDVMADRETVRDAIDEANQELKHLSVRLEYVGWDSHAYSMAATDGQEAINSQISHTDWDIFLGLMWARFGQATPRSSSGTKEEFDHAIQRWKTERGRVEVTFFFCTRPIPVTADWEQLKGVQQFRSSVQDSVLFREYASEADLRKEVRRSLVAAAIKLSKPATEAALAKSERENDGADPRMNLPDEYQSLGWLELTEIGNSSAVAMAEAQEGVAASLRGLMQHLKDANERFPTLQAGNLSPQQKRRAATKALSGLSRQILSVTNEIKAGMDDLDRETPLTLTTLSAAAEMYCSDTGKRDLAVNVVRQLREVAHGLETFLPQVMILVTAIGRFPRISKEFRTARRELANTMQRLHDSFAAYAAEARRLAGVLEDRHGTSGKG